jgi:hypothetical protein
MSCCNTCGSSPCLCVPRCPETCPEVVEKTATNINLTGVGVYDGEVLDEFQFRGINSTNAFITVSFNAATDSIDLTFNSTSLNPTITFANAATRANTAPQFDGQVGVQLDTEVIYVGDGVGVGSWISRTLFLINQTVNATATASTVTLDGGAIVIQSPAVSGSWQFDGITVSLTNAGLQLVGANADLTLSGTARILATSATGEIRNFGLERFGDDTRVWIGDGGGGTIIMPASSVLVTTATAGQPSSKAINTFLSTSNVQVYGVPTGTLDRTTFDTAVVTLPELAERVAALITDLQATLKPST